MRKLTTSTGAKITAVLLLLILTALCALSTLGSVFVMDSGLLAGSKTNDLEDLRRYRQNLYWGEVEAMQAEGISEAVFYGEYKDDLPAYAEYWNKLTEYGYYGYVQRMGNLKLQFWDYSDDSVAYTEEGAVLNARSPEGTEGGADGAASDGRSFYSQAPELAALAAMGEDVTREAQRYIGHGLSYVEPIEEGTEESTPGFGMELMNVRYLKDGLNMEAGSGRCLLYMRENSIFVDSSSQQLVTESPTWVFMYRNGLVTTATVADPLKYADTFWMFSVCTKLFRPFGSSLIPIAFITGILALLLLFWLLFAAGRRPAEAAAAAADAKGEAPGVSRADVSSAREAQLLARCDQKTLPKGFVIRKRWTERIPLDLFFIGAFLLCLLPAALASAGLNLADSSQMRISTMWVVMITTAALICGAAVVAVDFFMSLSVQIKIGKWWKNNLIWMACAGIWHLVKKVFSRIFGPTAAALGIRAGKGLKLVGIPWKLCLIAAAALIFNVAAGHMGYFHGGWIVLALFVDAGLMALVLAAGLMLARLKEGGEHLARGEMDAKVDTAKLFGSFREHGEHLNSISDGMALAIDQRMRSEHLKTELITNVSHDIKTPLTSIVSYVDLLSREDLAEKPAEYVEVLQRQSARLKKLTEDLVEASKAATGNISVSLDSTDLREAVNQAVGEYTEKFQAANLTPVITAPDQPVTARADGRLLWRVLDNLLSNVCKYSLPGTRVYITVEDSARPGAAGSRGAGTGTAGAGLGTAGSGRSAEPASEGAGGQVKISVKNISRECLNIPAEELMERFVRGDASRTSATEGSGLGLNIARSLTELQGGAFRLTVDGDLFKAEVTLRK